MTEIKWIDHGVLPTNNLGHAVLFYRDVLGAEIESLDSITTDVIHHWMKQARQGSEGRGEGGRPEGAERTMPSCFMRLGPTRFGLFLQRDPLPPADLQTRTPCYEWEVGDEDLSRAVDKLGQYGVEYEGPIEGPPDYPIAKQVFFTDLDGNHVALCVLR